MSTSVTFNGVSYTVPAIADASWGTNVSNYLIAIASGCLQKTGGSFTLSQADVDFGATYGLKAVYFKSKTTNIAAAGVVILAKTDAINWRNNANSADLSLAINGSDQLMFNSVILADNSSSGTFTNKNLSDSTVVFVNVSDATKVLKFSLGGATTGKTMTFISSHTNNRSITFPDATDTLVALTTTDTMSNKTFVAPVLGAATATSINKMAITAPATSSTLAVADGKTFTVSNTLTLTGTDTNSFAFPSGSSTVMTLASADTITGVKTFGDGKVVLSGSSSGAMTVKAPAAASTFVATFFAATDTVVGATFQQTLTNKVLSDSTIKFGNVSDTSKALLFSLGGATTAKTMTLISSHTNDRSITFPDATDTLVGKATTDTLTNKTLTGNTAVNLISGSGTLVLNTSGTATVPNATDTLVGKATTDVLTNKTLSGNTAVTLISGSGTLTLNTSGTVTLPNATDTLVGKATTDTLTNKTLTSPTITGMTATSIAGLALRDTSAAFDVTIGATSSTTISAGRALTLDMQNAAQTIKLTPLNNFSTLADGSANTVLSTLGSNGGYAWVSALTSSLNQYNVTVGNSSNVATSTNTNLLGDITAQTNSQTVTMTIATPSVFTSTAHGMKSGDKFYLTTSGALPTGLSASTTYFAANVAANTFNASTTYANAMAATYIATSGSQSGTHTLFTGGMTYDTCPIQTSTQSTTTAATGNSYGDVTSIVIGAGTWLLNGFVRLDRNSSTSGPYLGCGFGTTSGNNAPNLPGDGLIAFNDLSSAITTTNWTSISVTAGGFVVTETGNTTIYLKALVNQTSGTLQWAGRITAVRISR